MDEELNGYLMKNISAPLLELNKAISNIKNISADLENKINGVIRTLEENLSKDQTIRSLAVQEFLNGLALRAATEISFLHKERKFNLERDIHLSRIYSILLKGIIIAGGAEPRIWENYVILNGVKASISDLAIITIKKIQNLEENSAVAEIIMGHLSILVMLETSPCRLLFQYELLAVDHEILERYSNSRYENVAGGNTRKFLIESLY